MSERFTEAEVARCADQLAGSIGDGDRIMVATGSGEPPLLIAGMLEAADRIDARLEILQVMTGSRGGIFAGERRHRYLVPVPGRHSIIEYCDILPSSMAQMANAIRSGELRIDGVLFASTVIDDEGLAPALCVDLVPAALQAARFRATEINARLPRVLTDARLERAHCEVVVEHDSEPPVLDGGSSDETTRRIGANVAEIITDGSTLELGIGAALSGVADALVHRDASLAIHTGLISDWLIPLVDAGVAERPLACARGLPVVASVAMGSREFYHWLASTSQVLLAPTEHAHDPQHLMGLDTFVAVNSASFVDLSGQVGVPTKGADLRPVGGLLDFAIAGAYRHGSVIALRSLDRAGDSRIVPSLPAAQITGSLVTHVVTEHGIAQLAGRTWAERRRELISVADPDHRAWLHAQAP